DRGVEALRDAPSLLLHPPCDGVGGSLAELPAVEIDAAHPRRRREGDERRLELGELTAAEAVLVLGEDDDRPSFRRLVRKRRELRHLGELADRHAVDGDELRRLTVAERD